MRLGGDVKIPYPVPVPGSIDYFTREYDGVFNQD